jgi:Spy/CpxP family protein refolding chaperone
MSLDRVTRTRLTTAVVLLLVLGSGIVLGVALDRELEARADRARWSNQERPEGRDRGFDPRSRGPSMDSPSDRSGPNRRPPLLVEQVGLTEEQHQKIDSIVDYYGAQMRDLHDEFDEAFNTRFREIMTITRDEIKAVLTPEQSVAYDSIRAEWSRRREERRQDSASARGDGGKGPGI